MLNLLAKMARNQLSVAVRINSLIGAVGQMMLDHSENTTRILSMTAEVLAQSEEEVLIATSETLKDGMRRHSSRMAFVRTLGELSREKTNMVIEDFKNPENPELAEAFRNYYLNGQLRRAFDIGTKSPQA
jgi:hypothetical protein